MKVKSLRPSQGGKFHPPVVPTVQQKTSAYQCPGVDWGDAASVQDPVVGPQKPGDVVSFADLEIGREFTWNNDQTDLTYRKKVTEHEYEYILPDRLCDCSDARLLVIVR